MERYSCNGGRKEWENKWGRGYGSKTGKRKVKVGSLTNVEIKTSEKERYLIGETPS